MKIIKTARYNKIAEKWRGSGAVGVELSYSDGSQGDYVGFFDTERDKKMPPEVGQWIMANTTPEDRASDRLSLEVCFDVSGESEAASMYGGRDNLGWPASREEERRVSDIILYKQSGKIQSPKEMYVMMEDLYSAEIDETEVRTNDDYDGPDSYSDLI
jgi:hypothetical protein